MLARCRCGPGWQLPAHQPCCAGRGGGCLPSRMGRGAPACNPAAGAPPGRRRQQPAPAGDTARMDRCVTPLLPASWLAWRPAASLLPAAAGARQPGRLAPLCTARCTPAVLGAVCRLTPAPAGRAPPPSRPTADARVQMPPPGPPTSPAPRPARMHRYLRGPAAPGGQGRACRRPPTPAPGRAPGTPAQTTRKRGRGGAGGGQGRPPRGQHPRRFLPRTRAPRRAARAASPFFAASCDPGSTPSRQSEPGEVRALDRARPRPVRPTRAWAGLLARPWACVGALGWCAGAASPPPASSNHQMRRPGGTRNPGPRGCMHSSAHCQGCDGR